MGHDHRRRRAAQSPGISITGTRRRPATLAPVRILGVDLGHKRIGLAVSDEGGAIAFPAGTLSSRGRKKDLAALREMIHEKQIGRAVVGLPLHMDGRRGPEAENALEFAAALARSAGIPVDTLDERWTSMEAERVLDAGGRSTRTKKDRRRNEGKVDEMAASIILRTYLERLPAQRAEEASAPHEDPESTGP